jgi:hypothetical protein
MSLIERRGKIRVGFHTQIMLEAGGEKIRAEGSSRDLSLSGIFVDTDEKISLDTPCKVAVVLPGTAEPLVLQMDGRIVRHDASGIGITFDSMDLDSYTHLKNIVRYNAANHDDIV